MFKDFRIGRFIFSINWAKSGAWGECEMEERRIEYFSIYSVRRKSGILVGVVLGPALFLIGKVAKVEIK